MWTPESAQPADWERWAYMRSAGLKETIALSLDKELRGEARRFHLDPADLAEIFGEEYLRRWAIINNHLGQPGELQPLESRYGSPIIGLAAFAAWVSAKGLPWKLPARFPRPAEEPQVGQHEPAKESTEGRRQRLQARSDFLRASGAHDYSKRTALEERITPERLRQILRKAPQKEANQALAHPFGQLKKHKR